MASDTIHQQSTVLISLGANTPEALKNIVAALRALSRCSSGMRHSRLYRTKAENLRDHSYINAVAKLRISSSCEAFSLKCKSLERKAGRTKYSKSSGKVPLDIDILAWNGKTLNPEKLQKPYLSLPKSDLGL